MPNSSESFTSKGSHSVESMLQERVFVSDGLVFLSGLSAADIDGGIPAAAAVSPEFPYYGADIQKQTTYVLEKLSRLLAEQDCRLEDVVKTQVFLTDCRHFDAFDQVWKKFFPVPPPRTTVGVGAEAMHVPGALVAVDAIAAVPSLVEIRAIDSPRLPKPLANYTPCVGAGDWLFLAGQLPTEFGTTGLAPGAQVNPHFPHHVSPLVAQANFTIGICQTLLEDAGSDWDHTVRVHVFLKNLADVPLFEALWNASFDGAAPPYLVLGVDELLTGGALIEIDVIAVRAGTPKHGVDTGAAAPAGMRISAAGLSATTIAVAQAAFDSEDYRPFAIQQTVRAAFTAAQEHVGAQARPLKVHAFLPHPTDVFAFGRGLPEEVADTAAITTSPSVGASGISLEIIYRAD